MPTALPDLFDLAPETLRALETHPDRCGQEEGEMLSFRRHGAVLRCAP